MTYVEYNAAGQVRQMDFGSTDQDVFDYDLNTNRMIDYKYLIGSQTVVGNLTWNANGTLQSLDITDPLNSADTQNCAFAHDDLTRIASANCGSVWSQTFSYDAFGNIDKSGSSSFQPTYSSSTNRMLSLPGFTPSYDLNGNVLNDNFHSYSWDVNGRPLTIDTIGLTYDALGRMVEQSRGGAYTEILYNPIGEKFAVMNGQTLQKAFAPLPDGALAAYTSSGLIYYRHPDWLGSSRFASTPTRMYSDVAYGPFGEPYAQAGTSDLSFTGQNQDTTGGLYDFAAREYSIQGRWPSPDPAGLSAANPADPQTFNRYAYVRNSPLESIDPLGLLPCLNDWQTGCDDGGGDGNGGGGNLAAAVNPTSCPPGLPDAICAMLQWYAAQGCVSDLPFNDFICPDPSGGPPLPLLGGQHPGGNPQRPQAPKSCPSKFAQNIYASLIFSNQLTSSAVLEEAALAGLTGNTVIVGVSATGSLGIWEGLGGTGGVSIGVAVDPARNIGVAFGGKLGGGFAGTGYVAGGSITLTHSPTIFGVGGASPQVGAGGGNGVFGGSVAVNTNGAVTVTGGTGTGVFGTFGGVGGTKVIPLICQ